MRCAISVAGCRELSPTWYLCCGPFVTRRPVGPREERVLPMLWANVEIRRCTCSHCAPRPRGLGSYEGHGSKSHAPSVPRKDEGSSCRYLGVMLERREPIEPVRGGQTLVKPSRRRRVGKKTPYFFRTIAAESTLIPEREKISPFET